MPGDSAAGCGPSARCARADAVAFGLAMRMRQSIADIESAFAEQIEEERERAERTKRQAVARTRRREIARRHKHGFLRFVLLVTALLGTAILVTIVMFQTLYRVMG